MKDQKLEKNKEIVRRFFELGNQGNGTAQDELYTDDAVQITVPGYLPFWSGTHDRAKITQLVTATSGGGQFPNGFRMEIKRLTAEDDRVAVEAESNAVTADGRLYNNKYHFLITLRDGRIAELKEYFDNIHSALLLCGLGTEYYLDAEGNFKPLKELEQK